MKEQVDLIVDEAREVVTVAGGEGPLRGAAMDELHIVPDGAVAMRDGLIVRLTTTLEGP